MSQAIRLARRRLSLRRILGAAIAVACLAPAVLGDHPVLLVIANRDFYYYEARHMPDLDQLRSAGLGVPGLPGDGKAYCAPTSGMNLVLFIADHGFPEVAPVGDWQAPEAYNAATSAVLQLGKAMGTDAAGGTDGAGWYTGLKNTLGGKFVVSQFYANGGQSPTFQSMSMVALTGSVVTFIYGRYQILTAGPNGSLTVGERKGGHIVALSRAARDGDQMLLGSRNPADGDGDPLSQSLFGNTIWTAKDHTIHAGSFERTMSSLDYPQDDGLVRLIDGYIAVSPKAAFSLTNDRLGITYVMPAGFTGESRSPTRSFPSPDTTPIADLVLHPEGHGLLVVTEGTRSTPGGLYYVGLATGESRKLELGLKVVPGQLAAGLGTTYIHEDATCITDCIPDLLYLSGESPSPAGGAKSKAPFPPQAMAFDNEAQELLLLSISDRKLMRWAASLRGQPRVLEIPTAVPLSGKGDLAVDPMDGKVWILSEASNLLYGLSEDASRALVVETFADRAIPQPVGLDFDDAGHLFISAGGKIVEYEPTIVGGKRLWKLRVPDTAYFAGLPAGPKLRITKSTTNFDPAVHDLKPPYHIPPEETLPGRFEPDATPYNRRIKSVELTPRSAGGFDIHAVFSIDVFEKADAPRDLGTIVEVLDAQGTVLKALPFTVELPPSPALDPLTCGGLGCPGVCGEGMFRGQTVQMTCSGNVPVPGVLCGCTVDCPVPPIPCNCAVDAVFTVRVKPASGALMEVFTADDAMTCSPTSAPCGDPPPPRSQNRRLKSVDLTRGSDGRLEYAAMVHVDLLEAASAPRDLGTILRVADPTGRVIDEVLIDVEIPSGIGPGFTCGGLGCPGPCGEAPARGGIAPLVCTDEGPPGQCICTLVCPVSGPCDCAIDGYLTFSLLPAPGSLPERYLADDVIERRPPPLTGATRQVPGDCNQDGSSDISDSLCLFGFLFLGSPRVLPCGDGSPGDAGNRRLLDFNGDGDIDLSDGIGELAFLFLGGPPHVLGADSIAIEGCPGDEPGPAACAPNQRRDIDVSRIRLTGNFLLDGAPFPSSILEGANFFLRNAAAGDEVYLGLSTNQSYDVWVVPGTYDVIYAYKLGSAIPANKEAVIETGVAFRANATHDIRVKSVAAHGDFSIAGSPPPQSAYERGRISVLDRLTGAMTTLGETHHQAYAVKLVQGRYDVIYDRISGGTVIPWNQGGVLLSAVRFVPPGELDIDVPRVALSVSVLINGAQPPASEYEDGWILLQDSETKSSTKIGKTSDLSFECLVLPGIYDFVYELESGGGIVPRNSHAVVKKGVKAASNLTVVIDIPVHTAEGSLTLNGQAFPESAYERGRLRLRSGEDSANLGDTNDQAYETRVVPGEYDIVYSLLAGGSIVPRNGEAVIGKLTVAGPTVQDIDVHSAGVSASFLLDGKPFPAAASETAKLYLHDTETGDLVFLGDSHDPSPSLIAVKGTYEAVYAYEDGDLLPRNTAAVVVPSFVVKAPLVLQIDVPTAALCGDFLLAGAPFPPAPGKLAGLSLRSLDGSDRAVIGSTAPGSYSLLVVPGEYNVHYEWVFGVEIPKNKNAVVREVTAGR